MTNQKNIVTALSASSLLSCSFSLYAEELIPTNSETPSIVVTATRTANTVDETLAPVSIITKEDIERSQATSISDVLKTVPWVNFTSNG